MNFVLERALFVVAPRDSGKSTQLRSMFRDRRLGTQGTIPTASNISESYYLSNERRMHLRLTSPHEMGETPKEYMDKARGKMVGGRWSFASAFQPEAYKQMPDIVETTRRFLSYFEPERLRVIFLSPNRHGAEVSQFVPGRDLVDELLQLDVEVACVDARRRTVNGLLLVDFFDFT